MSNQKKFQSLFHSEIEHFFHCLTRSRAPHHRFISVNFPDITRRNIPAADDACYPWAHATNAFCMTQHSFEDQRDFRLTFPVAGLESHNENIAKQYRSKINKCFLDLHVSDI